MVDLDDNGEPSFLRRHWPFVVVPALIVLAIALWFLFGGDSGGFGYGGF
jgi:hypothetical protein